MNRAKSSVSLSLLLAGLAGCGGTSVPPAVIPPLEEAPTAAAEVVPAREAPPESGPRRDVAFPAVARATLANGLEINTVELHQLPVVHLRLVIESGGETDPAALPGLADLVAQMMREGTSKRSSAELAEAIEFLGADMNISADSENVVLSFRVMRDHLETAMDLLAEVATKPAFRAAELTKLKRRELDRLALSTRNPSWLARRAFYKNLYGDHPYAHVDTTEAAVNALTRRDLTRWHTTHFVPSNAFLIVAGDVTAAESARLSERAFGKWKGRAITEVERPAPPARSAREIVLVDRPGSAQSVLLVGNLAIERSDAQWLSLEVANQILGGSAAARLFMDLREQRSLTYGAYSAVPPRIDVGPFVASTSVRTEVTGEALGAIFEHLDRITTEAPSAEEITNAERFLADSFPLQIETPAAVASRIAELRVFSLPDDYFDTYRSRVQAVTADEALAAARATIHPDKALVVVVGEASALAESLRRFGDVRVVDTDGATKAELPAIASETPATEAPATEAPADNQPAPSQQP